MKSGILGTYFSNVPPVHLGRVLETEPQFLGTFLVQVLQSINKEQGGPEAQAGNGFIAQ